MTLKLEMFKKSLIATTLVISTFGAFAQAPATPADNTVNQVKRDNANIRKDNANIGYQKSEIAQDNAVINKNKARLSSDQKKLTEERKDRSQERKELHGAREKKTRDVRKGNQDAAKIE